VRRGGERKTGRTRKLKEGDSGEGKGPKNSKWSKQSFTTCRPMKDGSMEPRSTIRMP
jgi:hypothetical protein